MQGCILGAFGDLPPPVTKRGTKKEEKGKGKKWEKKQEGNKKELGQKGEKIDR